MEQSELSRRKVLSALGAAGSTGAIAGSGAATVFFDTEEITDSSVATGAVDLVVDWDLLGGGSGSSTGDATIPLTITEHEVEDSPDVVVDITVSLPGAENNAAYPWFRLDCPDPVRLAADLSVTIAYDDGETIASGSLVSVATELRNGEPLNPDGTDVAAGERDCLQPGETIDLVLTADLPDWYIGEGSLSAVFDFDAIQCRNNDGETPPYPDRPECPTPPDRPDRKAISYVAFCSEADHPDPDIVSVNAIDDEGAPTSVDWETDADVEYVAVKSGQFLTIYDYSDDTVQSGTAKSEDEDAFAIVEQGTELYGNGDNSVPCTVAERVVTDDAGEEFEGTQVKFEYEDSQ